MSTLKTNTIEGSGGDTGTKFTVDNDSTYIEGNSGKSLNFIQATIKGYSTVFDQGDGSQKRTLNISSTSDVGTGHLHYTHTNNYIATSGYVQMPNDTSSATKGFINNPVGGSEAATASLSQSNLYNVSSNLVDGKHAVTFGGELA